MKRNKIALGAIALLVGIGSTVAIANAKRINPNLYRLNAAQQCIPVNCSSESGAGQCSVPLAQLYYQGCPQSPRPIQAFVNN